jgi:hypothetical protein
MVLVRDDAMSYLWCLEEGREAGRHHQSGAGAAVWPLVARADVQLKPRIASDRAAMVPQFEPPM